MKTIMVALLLWSAFAGALLLLAPGMSASIDCMSLVEPTAACEEQQMARNTAAFLLWTWPTLLVIAAGYGAIVLIAVSGRRRSQRRTDNDQVSRG